jgi:hypothetical protein
MFVSKKIFKAFQFEQELVAKKRADKESSEKLRAAEEAIGKKSIELQDEISALRLSLDASKLAQQEATQEAVNAAAESRASKQIIASLQLQVKSLF